MRPLAKAGVAGDQIAALAIDTTGSSVIPVDKNLQPLGEYYLWCDHRAKSEAAEITEAAHAQKLAAIDGAEGVYSSEWGFAKLLHWLRHNAISAPTLLRHSSTATWWPPRCAGSPIRAR